MESLEYVESISALILHSFSTQIEIIFKSSQTFLLACLNHIFWFKCPKIMNL
jgi:hypothetical protein